MRDYWQTKPQGKTNQEINRFQQLGWETIRGQTEDNMETKQRTRR